MTSIHLRVLGPFQADIDGQPLPTLTTHPARTLFARLALDHPTPLTRTQIVTDLYPDLPGKVARPRLRTTLYYVRRALPDLLLTHEDSLGLLPTLQISHDVGYFDALTGPDADLPSLARALDLVRGPFLDPPLPGWATTESEIWHDRTVTLIRRVLALAQVTGDPAVALTAAQRWTEIEPWQAEAHLAAIRLLIAVNDRPAAQDQLVRARAVLTREGMPLPPELETLARSAARLAREPSQPLHRVTETLTRLLTDWEDHRRTGRFEQIPTLAAQATTLVEAARPVLATTPSPEDRWRFLCVQEQIHALAGDRDARRADLDRLTDLAQESDRTDWRLTVYARWGRAEREWGRIPEATRWLEHALDLAQRKPDDADPAAVAEVHFGLASVLDDAGKVTAGLVHARQAHDLAQAAGQWDLHLRAATVLSYLQMRVGAVDEAGALLAAVVAHPRLPEHPSLAARIMRQQGIHFIVTRRWEDGLAWLRRSLIQARAAGDVQAILICQTSLLYELARFGHFDESLGLVDGALDLAQRLNARTQQAMITGIAATAHYHRGDFAAAQPLAEDALALVQQLALPEPTAATFVLLAALHMQRNQVEAAQRAVDQAHAAVGKLPHPTVIVAHVAAEVALARSDLSAARAAALRAQAQVTEQGLTAADSVDVLWRAGQVIAHIDGDAAARPLLDEAYRRLLADLADLSSIDARHAYVHARAAHRAAAHHRVDDPTRLVLLPRQGAPTGRPLHEDELAQVLWHIDHPVTAPAERRAVLMRLTQSALNQGGIATVEALAHHLHVSARTILRDLASLRAEGHDVITRGSGDGGQKTEDEGRKTNVQDDSTA